MSNASGKYQHDLTIHIGHDELVIRQRYEVLSIANDILVGLWFLDFRSYAAAAAAQASW